MIEDHFVMRNEQSYAAFCGYLSFVHMKAFIIQKDIKSVLYADDRMFRPAYNEPESAVERIKFIKDRMVTNGFNVDLEIIKYDSMKTFAPDTKKVGMVHPTSQCWSMKKTGPKEIVTCNLPPTTPNFMRKSIVEGGRQFSKGQIEEHIKPDAYIDYHTPIQKVYDSLNKSKLHISYQGGTSWISILMGVPTIIVHNVKTPESKKHLQTKIYGQEGAINYYNNNQVYTDLRHPIERHITIERLSDETRTI